MQLNMKIEEIAGAPPRLSFKGVGELSDIVVGSRENGDGEMLDELLTTSRGEVKVRTSSFNEERQSQLYQDEIEDITLGRENEERCCEKMQKP
ncbi:Boron transporter 4 [Stylosanthes scabra]|uniref:Boron transporter 4 n=1 Tax=Stylosanthes scabra TaxID=79078 RepID=A0ABU6ZG68_9FABA|nr:Boron transporter 4 [Stylosanthes scabra]